MKKLYLFLAVVVSLAKGMACDACNLYEYTSLKNRSYAAFFYNNRLFNGYDHLGYSSKYTLTPNSTFQQKGTHFPNSVIKPNQNDYELYQTFEARVNINLNDKYNLLFIVPHRKATLYFSEVYPEVGPVTSQEVTISGIGDAIIGVERLNNYLGVFTHRLKYGVAIKMPTGEHERRDAHNFMYDPVVQPGTGSWDFIFRATYLTVYEEKIGLSAFINARVNTKSSIKPNPNDSESSQYKFGNRLNFNMNLFYILKKGDLQLVPKSGVYYESASHDWLYTSDTQNTVDGTGGNTWFWNVGLDINYKVFTLQSMWQKPISDKLNGNQIGNAGRLMVGAIYNFDL